MQRNINANTTKQATFYGLGIAPRLLDIIASKNFVTPTPIQEKAIPVALEGKDIIGIAQTGTGKTLAFGIPMIQKIAQERGRGMIILPTRELAHQVEETLHLIGRSLNLRTVLLIGGASMKMQMQALARNPHIIVGTPGRINDHLMQKTLSLQNVSILVLDEADRMLDMGFLPQIRKILAKLSKNRQTMLFSATMPIPIIKIAGIYMRLPVCTEIAPSGTAAEKVSHEVFVVRKDLKEILLEKLLKQYKGPILLFTRTKRGAQRLTQFLKRAHNAVAEIHSDRNLGQRKEALSGFKSGRYRILVATDIAARGIDVHSIELVINYDLPDDPENYVHRIGRTGRAGKEGHAISFATPDQKSDVTNIEKVIKMSIALSEHPEIPAERFYVATHTFKQSFTRRNWQHSRRRRSHR